MECGLSRNPEQRKLTSLQMENTYVRSLLDGKGLFLLSMLLLMMQKCINDSVNWLID